MVMADDGDLDRGRRRRRRGSRKPDYDRDMGMPSKPTIILAKPIAESKKLDNHNNDGPHATEANSVETATNHVPPDKTPVLLTNHAPPDKTPVLLKLRDGENFPHQTLNGSVQNLPGMVADVGAGAQAYSLKRPGLNKPTGWSNALSEGSSHARLLPPTEMIRSVKLVDDCFMWCEGPMEMLLDQTDFLVVGVIGMQGVGKSTVLSHLATGEMEESARLAFRGQSADTKEICSHQTNGIDMYVTGDRIIYLDSQPLMSPSLLHSLIYHEKKFPTEYTTAENCIEMQSLQIASFLLTVCNVVIVVADWFLDPALLRCLRSAEMLKPPTPALDSTHTEEYYPNIALVLNRAVREDFGLEPYAAMQSLVEKMMDKSKLKYRGGFTMAQAQDVPHLTKRTVQQETNVFLLPEQPGGATASDVLLPGYQGHPGFSSLIGSLRRSLLSVPRQLLTHTPLSEKNWFHYAGRTWEGIKKSQLFSEYNRLLP